MVSNVGTTRFERPRIYECTCAVATFALSRVFWAALLVKMGVIEIGLSLKG